MNNSVRRRRIATLMFLLPLLLLLPLACDSDRSEEKTVPEAATVQSTPQSGLIVAVGDSLTAGLGVDEAQSYPAQLQRKLEAAGKHYQVVNAGVSGETTSGTLSRLEWILTLDPDIVILEIGANDGLRGIDPEVPAKNIRQILRTLEDHGVVVIFAGMKMVWNLGPAYTTSFNAIYPQIAGEMELIFMPFFLEDVATSRELNIEDGLHPNEEGYRKIVENLYPYVLEAIEEFEKSRPAG